MVKVVNGVYGIIRLTLQQKPTFSKKNSSLYPTSHTGEISTGISGILHILFKRFNLE